MSAYYLLNKYFVRQKQYFMLIYFISVCGIVLGQGSSWTAPDPSQYNYNATMTAIVKLEGVSASNVNDKLAVFSGSEIRGLSSSVMIGGDLYFFMTIVSNNVSEPMTIKYYHHAMDRVFTLAEPFMFRANQIYGTIDDYLVYEFYLEGIQPLVFSAFPALEGLENCPLMTIYLNEYILNRDDHSAIIWSFENNPDLIVSLEADTLHISGAIGFSGNTMLTLLVNDTIPGGLMYALTMNVTILPFVSALEWNGLPHQGIVIGDTFQIIDLDSFVAGDQGNGLLYDYYPIINEAIPPLPTPNWFVSSKYPITMTVTTRINYTPNYQFVHPDDKLIAMSSSGQITGVAVREAITGLFFLSAGSNLVGDSIKLRFYSGQKKQILNYQNKIAFDSGRILGNIESPYIIDFAPIIPRINADNTCEFEIIDTDYIGTEQFSFFVVDAAYPNCLMDSTSVTLCIVNTEEELFTLYRDADGDGLGDPDHYITTCVAPVGGYVDNDDDCNDGQGQDPNISLVIDENSSFADDDGIVCNGAIVNIQATGGNNFLWSSGQTTSSIAPVINSDSTFYVTVTFPSGCKGVAFVDIIKVDKIVTSSGDSGLGSLRSVLGCAVEGDTITYDIPNIVHSDLKDGIIIDKNVQIGINTLLRPRINVDFNTALYGLHILDNKTLSLQNIDIQTINSDVPSIFIGTGNVNIIGTTVVSKQ